MKKAQFYVSAQRSSPPSSIETKQNEKTKQFARHVNRHRHTIANTAKPNQSVNSSNLPHPSCKNIPNRVVYVPSAYPSSWPASILMDHPDYSKWIPVVPTLVGRLLPSVRIMSIPKISWKNDIKMTWNFRMRSTRHC